MAKQERLFGIVFLGAVALLLANDLFLKYEFHNTFTGKLSDFAGLFAFPYFLSAFYPSKAKSIYWATGLLFTVWKSEIIQPLLDAAHGIGLGINRTVDYWDLVALIILPVSYANFNCQEKYLLRLNTIFKPAIIAVCYFSFVATSLPKEREEINLKASLVVRLKASRAEVIEKLELDSLGNHKYECYIHIPGYNAEIATTIIVGESHNGNVAIQLDSIKKYTVDGTLFTGIDEDDVAAIKALTIKDYEKLFLDQKISRLYIDKNNKP